MLPTLPRMEIVQLTLLRLSHLLQKPASRYLRQASSHSLWMVEYSRHMSPLILQTRVVSFIGVGTPSPHLQVIGGHCTQLRGSARLL